MLCLCLCLCLCMCMCVCIKTHVNTLLGYILNLNNYMYKFSYPNMYMVCVEQQQQLNAPLPKFSLHFNLVLIHPKIIATSPCRQT